jgi:hypothetical protein
MPQREHNWQLPRPASGQGRRGLMSPFHGTVSKSQPGGGCPQSDGSREVAARFRPLAKDHHCSPPNRVAPVVATSCATAGTSPDGKLALGEFRFVAARNTGRVPRPIPQGTANLPKRQVHLSVQKTNHSSHTSTVSSGQGRGVRVLELAVSS